MGVGGSVRLVCVCVYGRGGGDYFVCVCVHVCVC